MRIVRLNKETVEQITRLDGEVTHLVGIDEHTGDLVTFAVDDGKLVNTLLGLVAIDGVITLPIADFQVVTAEPTSGQWDSPGTSPEEEDV